MLTRCRMKIRVNCITPGIWPSEMTGTDMNGHEYNINKFAVKAAKRCVAGRPGRPEEIIGPCILLSTKAGGYMNGGVIMVEGGRAMVRLPHPQRTHFSADPLHRVAASTTVSGCRRTPMCSHLHYILRRALSMHGCLTPGSYDQSSMSAVP